jgi:hypothetical protein
MPQPRDKPHETPNGFGNSYSQDACGNHCKNLCTHTCAVCKDCPVRTKWQLDTACGDEHVVPVRKKSALTIKNMTSILERDGVTNIENWTYPAGPVLHGMVKIFDDHLCTAYIHRTNEFHTKDFENKTYLEITRLVELACCTRDVLKGSQTPAKRNAHVRQHDDPALLNQELVRKFSLLPLGANEITVVMKKYVAKDNKPSPPLTNRIIDIVHKGTRLVYTHTLASKMSNKEFPDPNSPTMKAMQKAVGECVIAEHISSIPGMISNMPVPTGLHRDVEHALHRVRDCQAQFTWYGKDSAPVLHLFSPRSLTPTGVDLEVIHPMLHSCPAWLIVAVANKIDYPEEEIDGKPSAMIGRSFLDNEMLRKYEHSGYEYDDDF